MLLNHKPWPQLLPAVNQRKLKVIVHPEKEHHTHVMFWKKHKGRFLSIQKHVCLSKMLFLELDGTMKYHCMDNRRKSYRVGTMWRWVNGDRMFLWQHVKPFLFLNLDFWCLKKPNDFNEGRNSVLRKLIFAT